MQTQFERVENFADKIEAIERTKNDYIVPVSKLRMDNPNLITLAGTDKEDDVAYDRIFSMTDYAHGQLASKLNIPKAYYDRMEEYDGLREYTVNKLLDGGNGQAYMVRTLEDKCRAFLSDRYFVMDNYDVLQNSIFPAILPFRAEIEVKAMAISDTKMYIQLIFKSVSGEVKPGDIVYYGLTITNSEVGAGALDVKSFIYRLVCLNGAIGSSLFRKYHIGRRVEQDETGIFRADTIKAELQSYQLRIRDVVAHSLSPGEFEVSLNKLKEAREDKIEDLTATIQNVTKRFALSDNDGKYMLNNIIQEGEINRYGLSNSITSLAQQFDNPDRQYELEKTGNQIIELSDKDWKLLN